MSDPIRNEVEAFPEEVEALRKEVIGIVVPDGYIPRILREEVLVDFGERLLLKFSSDRHRTFISVGSKDHPDSFVAIEYVAKLLGWVDDDKWMESRQLEDQYVFADDESAKPPAPICSTQEWFDLAVTNRAGLDEFFGENFDSNRCELMRIVSEYLEPVGERSAVEALASR